MARVVFLQKDVFAKPAVMALSACVKRAGHRCFVVVADLEKDPVAAVLGLKPDVIGFSITTPEFPFMRDMGSRLRALCDKIIICGGAHATFYPEVIHEPYLDALCRGEGDEAFLEFLNALDSGANTDTIANLWVKTQGRVIENEVRPLVADLDSLPFYDREIYTRYGLYTGKGREILYHQVVMAGRGCPKSCSFCFNTCYNRLYRGKGAVVRRRSVGHVIAELKDLKRLGKVCFITLDDDSFTLAPRTWLHAFFAVYEKEIGIPFKINSTPAALEEDLVKRLKQAGCFAVKMGLESGNEKIRNRILNKNLSESAIVESARLLKKYGIRFQTFNMVGNPGESLAMAFETFVLNCRIRPDFVWCSLLNPYPGTDIYELCKNEGFLSKEKDFQGPDYSYFTGSPLDLPDKNALINLQKLLDVSVRLHVPEPVLRVLVTLPLAPFYRLLFGTAMVWGLARVNKGSLLSVVSLSLRFFFRYNRTKGGAS